MEFYRRNATGEAVQSLQERRPSIDRVQIVGVEYWENILNGTPAGTNVSLNDLSKWKNAKESRYGIKLPSVLSVQAKIRKEGAPTNENGLHIDKQVLSKYKTEIDKEVQKELNKEFIKW